MTFLIPGVKLVVKTFPSESFSLMEQLKSLEEIWNRSSSERVWTSFALFSTTSCRFSTLRIFSIMVISRLGSGAGMTGFSCSTCWTGFITSVVFPSGLRTDFAAARTAFSSFDAPPFVGFSTGAVIFVIVFRCCPADFFRHLARRGLRKNLCHREQTE